MGVNGCSVSRETRIDRGSASTLENDVRGGHQIGGRGRQLADMAGVVASSAFLNSGESIALLGSSTIMAWFRITVAEGSLASGLTGSRIEPSRGRGSLAERHPLRVESFPITMRP